MQRFLVCYNKKVFWYAFIHALYVEERGVVIVTSYGAASRRTYPALQNSTSSLSTTQKASMAGPEKAGNAGPASDLWLYFKMPSFFLPTTSASKFLNQVCA